MRRASEIEWTYRILKEIYTKWLSTNRILSYSGIGSTKGIVILRKLERLGFVESLTTANRTLWKATTMGVSTFSEINIIYQRLELL